MGAAICDLYSNELLRRNLEPAFHSYYHVEFREGFFMQTHVHERVEIMYARKGNCDVFADNERYRLEAGDFILINGNIPHKLQVDKNMPCRVLCLEFDFAPRDLTGRSLLSDIYRDVGEVRSFLKSAPSVLKLKDTAEAYVHLVNLFHELEHNEPGRLISIQYAFGQFLIKLARLFSENRNAGGKPSDQYVRDAIIFINGNYHEEIGVDEMAKHVKLNVSYFHKIFKKTTGETPMDYLNRIRINKAKMLLENSELPIIEICFFAGFNSRQYFTHAFKKSTGMTPRAYKQRQQALRGLGWQANACAQYSAAE